MRARMWKARSGTRPARQFGRDDPRQEPTVSTGSALIEVESLGKVYGGRTESVIALEDVSFTIGEREFVSIVGPSGCGKSTLLKILAGLIAKTSGKVRIGARDVAG